MKSSHTSRVFDTELAALRTRTLAMGKRCEQSVSTALEAFWKSSNELASQVRALDDQINRDEMAIDESALRILALRQPVAKDLRFLAAILKLVTDLERIGDEAAGIAEHAREKHGFATEVVRGELEAMATLTRRMLSDALSSIDARDARLAERVLAQDDLVDKSYATIMHAMSQYMAKDGEAVPEGLTVVKVARYLERISDHATNIAEAVIFMVRGEDVRHVRAHAADV